MKTMLQGSSKVKLINLYLTPLAFILVLMAVIFSEPVGMALKGSLILLGVSLVNNLFTASLVKRFPFVRIIRMVLNVAVNICLVYLLIGFWAPIWYLFLMTPVAAAVYSTRLKTFFTALLMSGLLAGIHLVRGVQAVQAWGQVLSQITLIIFLSLFINAIECEKRKK